MLRWCPVQFSCGWFSWFWLICSKIPMVSMLQVRPRCEMSPVQVLILAVIFLLCAENVDVTWVPCLEYHCLEFLFARCPFFLSLCLIFKIVLARNIALSNSLLARVTWHGQWRTGAWQACVLTLVTEADTMISSNPVGLRPLPRNLRVWKCFVPGWGFVSPRRSCSRFLSEHSQLASSLDVRLLWTAQVGHSCNTSPAPMRSYRSGTRLQRVLIHVQQSGSTLLLQSWRKPRPELGSGW